MFDDWKEKAVQFFSDPVSLILSLITGCVVLAVFRFYGLDIDKGLDAAFDLASGRAVAHERRMQAAAAKAKAELEKCEAEAGAVIAKWQKDYDDASGQYQSCYDREHWSNKDPDRVVCDGEHVKMLQIRTRLNEAKRFNCRTASIAK